MRLIATAEGIDVLCEAPDVEAVRAALIDAGASPASEAAAEIVRVERGRPRYGVDIDESTIPQEAGLNERAVSFTKGCYVGQETVARLHYRGKPNRHLRGLRFFGPPDPAPPAPGEELRLGERSVGRLGSVVESPRLGTIALALVRREASPGDTLTVGEHGGDRRAGRAALPGVITAGGRCLFRPYNKHRQSHLYGPPKSPTSTLPLGPTRQERDAILVEEF